jgi:hypothetical protein
LKLIFVDLSCCTAITSPSLTNIDQEDFPIVTELLIEPSCFENYSDMLLSPNHECALEDISYSHLLQDKNNNVDQLTQGDEIKT